MWYDNKRYIKKTMGSTLVETININAKDFTEHFLTCSTCINQYSSDSHEHQPKLLPCSHTVCRQCLERIVSSQPRSDAIKCMLIFNIIFFLFWFHFIF
jgi:tripartite motif-containing protein 2/3